ncbi:hypothetical protein [Fournierella sp.]|uniref:hypothetical protein n=1 Tax=Allofournierella sp. TaxID=1940256 RepID=UPI003078F4E5
MKMLLSLVCCLLAALLAGCAPSSSAPASTSLPDSGSPASVSQPAGEPAASEAPEWTDEAVAELFLAQEQNQRRTVLDCAAVPDGGEELVGVVLYAEPEHTDVRLAFLSSNGTFQPMGLEATPADPSGLTYLGEGKFRLDLLDENGEPSGQVITFRRDGAETFFAVEPENDE